MRKFTHSKAVQSGYIDRETQEVIELIHNSSLPADFFTWLSGGSFNYKILQENISGEKYTRIIQMSIDDNLVYTGRMEYNLSKASKELVHFLTKKRTPIDSTIPDIAKFCREVVAHVTADPYHTILSSIYYNDEKAGFSWEMFELPAIVQIYNNMNDPLRHWRNA